MRKLTISTAGHINHGKTTLVKTLAKEREIIIEKEFTNFVLPSGIVVEIIDASEPERFIKNMVAGTTAIDLVILVIAADEGIMPQTKEHLEICELLKIKDGIVVLTKIDLVEKERLELLKDEVKKFLRNTFLEKAPIICFSALTGEGKEEILKALDEKVSQIPIKSENKPFRLYVDEVSTVKGFNIIVKGRIISGKVTLNQMVKIYPQGIQTKVRNIQVHGKNVEIAYAGMRTALNLPGVEKNEIKRGDVVADPDVLEPSQWLDIKIISLKDVNPPLKNFENLLFYIGTSEVLGKLILFGKEYLKGGEEDIVQIYLQKPVTVWRGDRFILRRPSTNTTVAGGEIINPYSYRKKRTKPWERQELEFISQASNEELIKYYIEKRGILGINEKHLQIHLSLFGDEFQKYITKLSSEIIRLKEKEKIFYFSKKAKSELKNKIIDVLRKYHENNPFSSGLTKEFLKSRISSFVPNIFFDYVIEELIQENIIKRENEILALSQFREINLTEKEELKKKIEEKFLKEGLMPRNYEEILFEFKDRYKAAKDLFQDLLKEGILVKVSEKIVYHYQTIEEVEKKVIKFLSQKKEMSISDFRNLLGAKITRKYLIPLAEYLDKRKITLRIGDKRVLRKKG